MSSGENRYEIFSFFKRLQHNLFTVFFCAALLTGAAAPGGYGGLRGGWHRLLAWAGSVYRWHVALGLAAVGLLLLHLFYLLFRCYIEELPVDSYPLLPRAGDGRDMLAELRDLATGGIGSLERYSPLRKLIYWLFLGGTLLLAVSGGLVFFWDWLDMPVISSHLGGLAALHGGAALLLGVLMIWHAEIILAGGRRLKLLRLVVSGSLAASELARFYPREFQAVQEEERRLGAERGVDREKAEAEQQSHDRTTIEQILEGGNVLAKSGDFEGAAEVYREALSRFPGYSQAKYNLALVLEKMGHREEALAEYRRFLHDDPFHPLCGNVRAGIARLEG